MDLLSILLQLGADVDPLAADGGTPLSTFGLDTEAYAQARLLLEWGAELSKNMAFPKENLLNRCGKSKLANLLNSEFGGRRCEVINLPNRPDLFGKTCVVEKHLPNKGRYKVIFETSKEAALLGPHNLKRRDRTPDDCGYYISYKNGRTTRHDFASNEECQAFIGSLAEGDKSRDADAEARAEEAAASLLAELNLDSSATDSGRRIKTGKKMGRNKGRK